MSDLLNRAKAELDYLKRVELYRQVEKEILEDAPLVPLSYNSYERVFQPYVKNLQVSALEDPYIPMKSIWLDRKPIVKEAKQ